MVVEIKILKMVEVVIKTIMMVEVVIIINVLMIEAKGKTSNTKLEVVEGTKLWILYVIGDVCVLSRLYFRKAIF